MLDFASQHLNCVESKQKIYNYYLLNDDKVLSFYYNNHECAWNLTFQEGKDVSNVKELSRMKRSKREGQHAGSHLSPTTLPRVCEVRCIQENAEAYA